MKKRLLVLLAVVALLAAATVPAFADEETGVSCTVTPRKVSVTVDYPNIAYGVVSIPGNAGSPTAISAINNGTVTEDFNIRGADAKDGTDTTRWTLSPTAIGAETFMHEFGLPIVPGSSPTWPTVGEHNGWTPLSTGYQPLATGMDSGTQTPFVLQIWTPSSTAYYVPLTTIVTVQASMATP